MVAGVGFEPHDLLLMRQAKTTSSLPRYKTGASGLNRTDCLRVTNPAHRQQCFRGIKLWWRIADSNCLLMLAKHMCSQLAPIPHIEMFCCSQIGNSSPQSLVKLLHATLNNTSIWPVLRESNSHLRVRSPP